MSGFDNAKVDAEFFPDGRFKSNFLVNLGYGDPAKLHPRLPRLDFDQACRIECDPRGGASPSGLPPALLRNASRPPRRIRHAAAAPARTFVQREAFLFMVLCRMISTFAGHRPGPARAARADDRYNVQGPPILRVGRKGLSGPARMTLR